MAGDPVDVLTGRLSEEVVDWSSGGDFPLELKRQYTSTALTLDASPFSSLGLGWRSNFDARVRMNGQSATQADWANFILPDTMEYAFNRQNGVWKFMAVEWRGTYWPNVSVQVFPRFDMDVALTVEGQQFVLRAPNGVRYVFDTASHAADPQWRPDGYRTQLLSEVRYPGGYTQKIAYVGDYPSRVSDNLGRWIDMQFTAVTRRSTLLTQARTNDGSVVKFAYQDRLPGLNPESPVDFMALTNVTYPDLTPGTDADNPKLSYQYKDGNGTPGLLLTGTTDERGVRFATWTYDATGRVLSSEHANGQDRTQFAYDDTNNVATVTNPLGRSTRYSYRLNRGYVHQLLAIDGIATPGCAASNTRYEYDANGFRSKATDAEGRVTSWTRNRRGLPLTERQAVGTTVELLKTMTWDATRPLILSLAEPGLTTTYTYDAQGRVLTRTETDTTAHAVPYSTNGQRRVTTYTYATPSTVNPTAPVPPGPIAIDGPLPGNSDTVRFGYDAAANLISVTNELGQVTGITSYDAGGRPLKIIDYNGVITNMAYDARGRLTVVTVNPGATQSRTAVTYDAAGQVTRITATDGSYLNYTWSDAKRLVTVSNNAGERIDYGYNPNGDVTSRTIKSSSGAIVRQQSAVFDELGRLMRAIGAAGQETLFRYDRTDKPTEVRDPRGGLFAYAYDGLQNLASLTNQAGGSVTLTRDGQGRVTTYRDARGLATTYVRNGFGEVIQESGPDMGNTVIVRDERGLPTKITDPRGVVSNLVHDAAGRLVKQSYPADLKQSVIYSYDDTTNGNKGIGRLTGISDASGSLARSYDSQGRVTAETRRIGDKAYSTAYAYNAAGRLTAITYPSGRVVGYARNGLGRVSAVATRPTATAPQLTVASGLAFGPMSTRLVSLIHGNGLTATRAYDGDGRLTALKLANGSTRLMDVSYAYGDGMNLTAVNDNLAAARSVSLAYDAAQRLSSARGPWGQLAYAYTPNGDRAQEVLTPPGGGSALTTKLSYPAASNRLAATSVGSLVTRSFAYDAAGNLIAQAMGPLRLSFGYNLRNRPVTVTRTGDGTQVSKYGFNALEQMVSRSTTAPGGPAGGVHYIYGLDGSLLAEADAATGAILREYIWLPLDDASPAADNDNEEGAAPPPLPLALVSGVNTAAPSLLMVHADHLGRPVRLTDMTRATVWQASYDPFGLPVSMTGTVEQNLRFPGQYFLIESGLSYNWHRFYDPATGRYTQSDPLRFVDGPSVYGYAGASPMMQVDPEGLSPYVSPGMCVTNPQACVALCLIYPSACYEDSSSDTSMCVGPSEDHAKEECDKAADGSDDDWRFFCNGSSFFGKYDTTRPSRCQRESNSSRITKRNWCYNEYGE